MVLFCQAKYIMCMNKSRIHFRCSQKSQKITDPPPPTGRSTHGPDPTSLALSPPYQLDLSVIICFYPTSLTLSSSYQRHLPSSVSIPQRYPCSLVTSLSTRPVIMCVNSTSLTLSPHYQLDLTSYVSIPLL